MKRIIIDYFDLPSKVLELLKLKNPNGFKDNLVTQLDDDKKQVVGIVLKTRHKNYFIKMSSTEAQYIIKEDSDYNGLGNLKDHIRDNYQNNYDLEYDDDDDDDDDDGINNF